MSTTPTPISISIPCLLLSHHSSPLPSPFSVDLQPNSRVEELKVKVKEKNLNTLRHVDARELRVWRCIGRSVVLEDEGDDMEGQVKKIFDSEEVEKVDEGMEVGSLEVGEEEILFVKIPRTFSAPRTQLLSNETMARLQDLHQLAWGRPWPYQSTQTITFSSSSSSHSTSHFKPRDSESTYTLLSSIDILTKTLLIPSKLQYNLVVLKEFEYLRAALEGKVENGVRSVVVVGHPGIGKTTFLLHLLLSRLSSSLPTALQISPTTYVIFSSPSPSSPHGVEIFPINYPSSHLTSECWILSDSTSFTPQPPFAFVGSEGVLVRMESWGGGSNGGDESTVPGESRWAWTKEKRGGAEVIVMDHPHVEEIACIAKEAGFNPTKAISLTRKYGPSPRTILNLLNGVYSESDWRRVGRGAAWRIGRDPSILQPAIVNTSVLTVSDLDKLTSLPSDLFFLRPVRDSLSDSRVLENGENGEREKENFGKEDLGTFRVSIPTTWLEDMLMEEVERVVGSGSGSGTRTRVDSGG